MPPFFALTPLRPYTPAEARFRERLLHWALFRQAVALRKARRPAKCGDLRPRSLT